MEGIILLSRWDFKALDRKGNWHIGYLIYQDGCLKIQEVFNIPPSFSDPCGDIGIEYTEILPDTVCQCTGLKNEDEYLFENDEVTQELFWDIYKKDICKFTVVFFRNGFKLKDKKGNIIEIGENFKIVDNIFNVQAEAKKKKINE